MENTRLEVPDEKDPGQLKEAFVQALQDKLREKNEYRERFEQSERDIGFKGF